MAFRCSLVRAVRSRLAVGVVPVIKAEKETGHEQPGDQARVHIVADLAARLALHYQFVRQASQPVCALAPDRCPNAGHE